MEQKKLETEEVIFRIENGILSVTYKAGVKVTIEKAKKIVRERIQFTEGKTYPSIANEEGLVSIDRKSRDYFISEMGIKGINSAAFVTNNIFAKYIANFFLKITAFNVPIPAKIFTDRAKALGWLEQFKED